MDLSTMDYHGVTLDRVPGDVLTGLADWRANVLSGEGKQGLWVFGQRGAGTTFAAQAIVGRVAFEDDGFADSEHVLALDLIELIRASWQASASIRQYGDDFAVFTESQSIQDRLDHLLLECRLLWVDDLHHETIDWNIWRKNVQPFIERRVKQGMPTVISTTLPPVHDFLPPRVIDTHFVTVFCNAGR